MFADGKGGKEGGKPEGGDNHAHQDQDENENEDQDQDADHPRAPREGRTGSEMEREGEASLGVRVALALLTFYKREISPWLAPACRFLPTCSEYAMGSYKKYGAGKGTVLTIWRLARCAPWGNSGYDPPTWPPPGLELVFGGGEGEGEGEGEE